jgi:hypothetical protein
MDESFLVLCAGHPVYKKEPLARGVEGGAARN